MVPNKQDNKEEKESTKQNSFREFCQNFQCYSYVKSTGIETILGRF
jgi:hypothetical protein